MGWSVSSYTVLKRTSSPSATADGTCLIAFTPPRSTQIWRVEAIAAVCDSATGTELYVWDTTPGGVPAAGTRTGNLTFGDGAPVTIEPGGHLVLEWRGCSEGAVAQCRVQVVVMVGTPGAPQPVSA